MDVKTYKHNYGIDLYRIICMIMIPCFHIMGWGVLEETHSLTWNNEICWLLEIMAYCAPNEYALISGYANYGKKQRYSSIIFRTIQVTFYTMTFYTMVSTVLFLLAGLRNIGVKSNVCAVFLVSFSVC